MTSTAPNYDQWTAMIAPTTPGVWVTHQENRHLMVVADQHGIHAWCACGWDGPDRTHDEHAVPLVVDDAGQHMHHVGLTCPEHEPPYWVCRECEEAGR